jgi:exosome complex RNA-binding protein Csl4
MRYTFKEPLTIVNASQADAQRIGTALEKIAAKNGGHLTPSAIVEEASNPKHVIHPHITWDDSLAAKLYRLDQARAIVRCIHVEDDETEDGHVQAFISISEKDQTSYRSITEIKKSVDLQSKVLQQAEADLQAWQNRYRSLTDICKIVREAQNQLKKKRERKQSTESRAQD